MSEANEKTLKEAFVGLNLPRRTEELFGKAVVRDIRVRRADMTMTVCLRMPGAFIQDTENDMAKADLAELIKGNFPGICEVHIVIDAEQGAPEPADPSGFWAAAKENAAARSPVCAALLKDAAYRTEGRDFVVSVEKSAMPALEAMGCARHLREFFAEKAGEKLFLRFEETETDETPPWEKPAVPLAINPTPAQNPEPKPKPNPKPIQADNLKDGLKKRRSGVKFANKVPTGTIKPLSTEFEEQESVLVEGEIFAIEDTRETRYGGLILCFDITDGTGAFSVKCFCSKKDFAEQNLIKLKNRVTVRGKAATDEFAREFKIMADEIGPANPTRGRTDDAETKRVELHLHTNMSAMDAIPSAAEYISCAAKWGHKAIAITDHGVVQAFPEAMNAAKKHNIKILYGLEGYLVNDLGRVVRCPGKRTTDGEFVALDFETTGLHKESDEIIEIGAVRIVDGKLTDAFNTFVNPGMPISAEITRLTGITDKDVADARPISEILPELLRFIGEATLVAHNAAFDVGFLQSAAARMGVHVENPWLDTVELSRALLPNLPRHKLNTVAEHFGIDMGSHHRAVDDARTAAEIFRKCAALLRERGVDTLEGINAFAGQNENVSKLPYFHVILLAKNQAGLKDLYELVSRAHIDHFYKKPRIPKSLLTALRANLIIGSACEAGELYSAILERASDDYVRELAEFYDYFEIQPIGNNAYLIREGKAADEEALRDINRAITALGAKHGKPTVATCDAHFLNPEDEVFRRIIMAGDGYKDADNQPPLFYRTTGEMLAEFEYLGEDTAREVVIDNTNKIADMCEDVLPIPKGTFAPEIQGADVDIRRIVMDRAREVYGDPLPNLIVERLDKELNSIITNGFAVMYIAAQKLVDKSMSDGYVVGSRGSVGSSLAATMAGITEVNPLPPHYRCPQCAYSDFESDVVKSFAGASGCDMPPKNCPVCGTPLIGDGHDIPFETFLGFDGDKEPDIDLNFSGEYQLRAHAYAAEIFGEENVFKAGTISALADKTAFGYVMKYIEERGLKVRSAEVNRLKTGCTGIRRTTGQHPGGLVILPRGHSIYEFCPVQRPANDASSGVVTTHFDYDALHGRLLKLDMLGHDVPTIIRMLRDMTGVDPMTVPLADKDALSLFRAPDIMGVTENDIGCPTGSLGLPEFGTTFVRQMLVETQPRTFAELARISGLSHGTNVWTNNAQDLIKKGVATLSEVIPGRDDIMVYLVLRGIEKKTAFDMMETIRKQGKTGIYLSDEQIEIMEDAGVPEWYIDSCRKIEYLFPKGHAIAYVSMTVRIAYFKLYHPKAFYAAMFSVKALDFDYEKMCLGAETAKKTFKDIAAMGKEATAKDKSTQLLVELVIEMYARGIKFAPIDLYKADVGKFTLTDDGIMPPLCSLQGLGMSVAQAVADARGKGPFISVEDFKDRTKANKNVLDLLIRNRVFGDMPESNQLSLF